MTLPKAIEIMELNLKEAGSRMPPDCKKAIEITLQASKRVVRDRGHRPGHMPNLLPGETRE